MAFDIEASSDRATALKWWRGLTGKEKCEVFRDSSYCTDKGWTFNMFSMSTGAIVQEWKRKGDTK